MSKISSWHPYSLTLTDTQWKHCYYQIWPTYVKEFFAHVISTNLSINFIQLDFRMSN